MKRKIYLEVEFDWKDYDDVSDELILEDSGIMDSVKDGVRVTLLRSEQLATEAVDTGVSKCTYLQDCDNCGAKQVQFICSGKEVCPECFC